MKFHQAVETARQHLPIERKVRKPEFIVGYTIVEHSPGDFRVYAADAWTQPSETPLLPWSPPSGAPVACVHPDGALVVRRCISCRDRAMFGCPVEDNDRCTACNAVGGLTAAN